MSNMQNRLEELQPYVIGIRYFQGLPVVDVVFKDKWVVPDSEIIKKVKGNGEENYYYFLSEKEGIGIDALLNHTENIINLNIEKEKKNELFKVKINELKKLFQTTSLDKLEDMKFILGSPIITTDFNPEDINLDDEDTEVMEPTQEIEPRDEIVEDEMIPLPEQPELVYEGAGEGQPNNRVINNTQIELPPKPSNGKIELEDHSIQTDDGPCNHGPDEFCDKCM